MIVSRLSWNLFQTDGDARGWHQGSLGVRGPCARSRCSCRHPVPSSCSRSNCSTFATAGHAAFGPESVPAIMRVLASGARPERRKAIVGYVQP
jgi:hypothetical protein